MYCVTFVPLTKGHAQTWGRRAGKLHPWYVVGHASGAHDQREDESRSGVNFDGY